MSEKLPEGWKFHKMDFKGNGYWSKQFGAHHRSPSGEVWKCKDGFIGEYYRNVEHVASDTGTMLLETISNVEATHKRFEAEQLCLRREAAQLYDGDYAALMVGEGEQG